MALLLQSDALGVSVAAAAVPQVLSLGSITLQGHRASGRLRSGKDVTLTLQPKLQRSARKLLAQARPLSGAALLVDVRDGRLLALGQFRRPGAPPGAPVTTGAPAASLFKLVTTTALFEHSAVTPKTRVCFSGGEHEIEREHLLPPPSHSARCSTFGEALGHSWNAVYAQLATEHLMRGDLLATAERLGFNQRLPFAAPASVGHLKLPYNDLRFARAAAGFEGSELSPLGAAHLTLAIARGGKAARLQILAGDGSASPQPAEAEQLISPNSAWRLVRMMEVTVHSGTSLEAFSNEAGTSYLGDVRVAGKTGTLKRGANAPTTSWFTGFAPSREPRVVVTVMLQNGKVWRRRANEVARDLLRVYFDGHRGVTSPFAH